MQTKWLSKLSSLNQSFEESVPSFFDKVVLNQAINQTVPTVRAPICSIPFKKRDAKKDM